MRSEAASAADGNVPNEVLGDIRGPCVCQEPIEIRAGDSSVPRDSTSPSPSDSPEGLKANAGPSKDEGPSVPSEALCERPPGS
mmetsp:Transcript_120698/g.221078  ORF Transcript_120698/g.221078 Transcript_120698/m.221078 type:complete len:83 (+) Transcript_120698:190-438(+)